MVLYRLCHVDGLPLWRDADPQTGAFSGARGAAEREQLLAWGLGGPGDAKEEKLDEVCCTDGRVLVADGDADGGGAVCPTDPPGPALCVLGRTEIHPRSARDGCCAFCVVACIRDCVRALGA